MNTRLLCSALVLASFAGAAQANAAQDAVTMSVDAAAPVQATLLPEVTVFASQARPAAAATMRVAATAPLRVTLLPTVRVNARAPQQLAVVTLPTVRVVAQADSAAVDALAYHGDERNLPRVEGGAVSARVPTFRASLMPQ